MRLLIISILLSCLAGHSRLQAQYLPDHVSNEGIYEFLDELANNQFITLTSVVRPYSRTLIALKLDEAAGSSHLMTTRQRHLLDIYREAFTSYGRRARGQRMAFGAAGHLRLLPPAYERRDQQMYVSVRPILEGHYHGNSQADIHHLHAGVSVSSAIGESWSAWGSLQGIWQHEEVLSRPGLLIRGEGGAWKQEGEMDDSYYQITDMRGGISYSWGWGAIAFQKEHLLWGDHYHAPNILDISPGRPTYPMISMHIRGGDRFSFHYHHGWLNSMVIQDTISFPAHPDRYNYHNKFFTTNLFTLMPLERLHVSAGNAIVYSASNMYIGNFIPFMVFRALEPSDAEISSGRLTNTMAFVNISSRQIPNTHLFLSWFANSFNLGRLRDSDRNNFTSATMGGRLSNWPVRDTDLTLEYTRTLPNTFEHRTPIITYAHEQFSMGHYLGANASQLYASAGIHPWRGLSLRFCYKDARKGNYFPHQYGSMQDTDPYMQDVTWRNTSYSVQARYLLHNNIGVYARLRLMNARGYDVEGEEYDAEGFLNKYTPAFYHGETTTVSFGVFIR